MSKNDKISRNDGIVTLSLDDMCFRTVEDPQNDSDSRVGEKERDLELGEPDHSMSGKPNHSRREKKRQKQRSPRKMDIESVEKTHAAEEGRCKICNLYVFIGSLAALTLVLIGCLIFMDSFMDEPQNSSGLQFTVVESFDSYIDGTTTEHVPQYVSDEPDIGEPDSDESAVDPVSQPVCVNIDAEVSVVAGCCVDKKPEAILEIFDFLDNLISKGHEYAVHDDYGTRYYWYENLSQRSLFLESLICATKLTFDKYVSTTRDCEFQRLFDGLSEVYYEASQPNKWFSYSPGIIRPKYSQDEVKSMLEDQFHDWKDEVFDQLPSNVQEEITETSRTILRHQEFILQTQYDSRKWKLSKGCFGCFNAPEREDLESTWEDGVEHRIERFIQDAPESEKLFLRSHLGERDHFTSLRRLTESYDECPTKNPFWDILSAGLLGVSVQPSAGQIQFRRTIRDASIQGRDKVTNKEKIQKLLKALREIYSSHNTDSWRFQNGINFLEVYEETWENIDDTWKFCCNWVSERNEKLMDFIHQVEGVTFQ